MDVFAMNGDKPAMLASQLIGAKLNVLIDNAEYCVALSIEAADERLAANQIGTAGADVNAACGEGGDAFKTVLDDYNNGRLSCAAHRG